jgi:salicylate hydroxylase
VRHPLPPFLPAENRLLNTLRILFLKHKRLPRATATQESSRLNQKIFHLPDGPEQRARDDAMRAAMEAELEGKAIPDGNPNQWADRSKNSVQFDYDAYPEVERWWNAGGRQSIEALTISGSSRSP